MIRDLIWAIRWLRRNPLFTTALTGILALGIAANTAVFSIVDAILKRPLPYPSADRLLRVEETTVKRANIGVTAAEYLEWRGRTDLFSTTAAYVRDVVTIAGNQPPDQVFLVRATPSLFPLLGLTPRLGHTPSATDLATVVLSDAFWRRRFQADPGVIGRPAIISGQVYTILGVMPPDFEFPNASADMWAPLRLTGAEIPWVSVAARLKNGVTLTQAQSAMDVVARQIEREHPKEKAGVHIVLTPWRETPARQYELTLVLLLVAVGLVLLIACADVSGLLLSRAVQRGREIAIRSALGAGFGRVLRQLLAESLILAAIGTIAGLTAARFLLHLLVRQLEALPIALPHLHAIALNHRVLLFNAALCVLLACALTLAPAFMVYRTDLQAFARSGRAASASRNARRLFSVLIGAEAAFAFILLAGSGLMIRSLARLQQSDHGLHPDHVLTMRVPIGSRTDPRPAKYDTKPRQMAYYRELLDRLRRVPGVRAAAVVNNLPLSGSNTSTIMDLLGGGSALVATRTVSPEYFQVMGIPLISGRLFTDADQPPAPDVAIINESLARQLFGSRNPLGQPLLAARVGAPPAPIVVGIVKDAAQLSYEEPAKAEMYRPYQQFIFGVFLSTIVVRTSGDPLALAAALQHEIWRVDAAQPVVKVETMDDVIEQSIWRPRFSAWIFSALGGLALLLTCAGVYSVVAYTTMLRAREVGIRVALGAVPRNVVGLLMREALLPLTAGLVVSLVASLMFARLLASLLYNTSAADPLAYAGAGLLLLAIGAIASAGPAWKAAASDPLEALRVE
jgi:putative ABC transport system permease protein